MAKQFANGDILVDLDVRLDAAEHSSTTLRDVLRSARTQGTELLAALPVIDGKTTASALSLNGPVPSAATQIRFIGLNSDHRGARNAFWLTSAYLLAYALSSFKIKGRRVLLSGGPRLLEESTAGGNGFSYDYVLVDEGQDTTSQATTYQEALDRASRFLNEQTAPPNSLSKSDKKELESHVAKVASADTQIFVSEVQKAQALAMFADNPLKVERILSQRSELTRIVTLKLEDGKTWSDLLPEDTSLFPLEDASPIAALQITEWSAATYTPSDPSSSIETRSQQLNNLRALSHVSSQDLELMLKTNADFAGSHRNIGRQQELFITRDVSPGSPMMLPHGVRLAKKMERVIRDLYDVHGYDEIVTPQIYKQELWEQSGHWAHYKDDMFAVGDYSEQPSRHQAAHRHQQEDAGGCPAHSHESAEGPSHEFGLKPMNCPGHCLVFASRPRTLKELPVRYSEWSPLHRNEAAGSLQGLTRVRRFHQDDAHIFCAPEQVEGEVKEMLSMLSGAYDVFGFPKFELVLSTRPTGFLGTIEEWDRAEAALRQALDSSEVPWELNEADGAFYGPKIDVRLVDHRGRKHQTATIQLDFQLPRRFDLTYEDGTSNKPRPVMIHRAILGSVERFMAILIESSTGSWPFWLNPRQAYVLPASTDSPELVAYAQQVAEALSLGRSVSAAKNAASALAPRVATSAFAQRRHTHKFHVEVDVSANRLNKRVRDAYSPEKRSNFVIVVGAKEREEALAAAAKEGCTEVQPRHMKVTVRHRKLGDANEGEPTAAWGARLTAALQVAEDGRNEGAVAGLQQLLVTNDRARGDSGGKTKDTDAAVPAEKWQWDVQKLRDTWVLMDDHYL